MPAGWGNEGFLRADRPRAFSFPEDHGPHDGYRSEWWYLTGNLRDRSGRRFGYQFTAFRIALLPQPTPQRGSAWSASHIWMAHLALTDVAGERHHHDERFAREALGLAGAQAEPLRVWVEDWQLSQSAFERPWQLRAASDRFTIELQLAPAHPPRLQGEAGLSRKGRDPGNASYYYSITRLASAGRVRIGDDEFLVDGDSWLDREWSTSALDPDQAGWDWFSLQLDDGSDLMFYRLRDRGGNASPQSAGNLFLADGRRIALRREDVTLTPRRWWRSDDGRSYPVAWTLTLNGPARRFEIEALMDAQLMALSVRYWEGAIEVREAGDRVGHGYLEMTGY
ncbi:MAG: carotenoid 1,2-hydratase [Gammaproteobacteria bacterium]|nr:carotenoid 1,2-hydratase [Gammaproteobacteria bacterium]